MPDAPDGPGRRRQFGQGNRGWHLMRGQPCGEQVAQGQVHVAEDEVVRLVRPDLDGRFLEVSAVQVLHHLGRPCGRGHLGVEQPRRPAAEEHGPAADAVGEAGEALRHVRPPGQAPHLRPRHAGIDGDRRRRAHPEVGQVLDVLGKHERPGLEHQDAVAGQPIAVEQVLGQDGPEGAAADDDDVERAGVRPASGAAQGLVQAVADVAAEHVLAEVGILRGGARRHGHVLLLAVGRDLPPCLPLTEAEAAVTRDGPGCLPSDARIRGRLDCRRAGFLDPSGRDPTRSHAKTCCTIEHSPPSRNGRRHETGVCYITPCRTFVRRLRASRSAARRGSH